MSFVLPYAAEIDTLNQMLNFFLSGAYMGLIQTAVDVGTGTTLADCVAAECTFAGYSRQVLTGWSTPVIDGDGAGSSIVSPVFTPTGGGGTGPVYGYFLVDSGGTYFYGVEMYITYISAPFGTNLVIPFTYTDLTRYTS